MVRKADAEQQQWIWSCQVWSPSACQYFFPLWQLGWNLVANHGEIISCPKKSAADKASRLRPDQNCHHLESVKGEAWDTEERFIRYHSDIRLFMRKRWNSSCAVTTAWVFCTIFLWLPTRTFIFALRIAFSKESFDSKQELSSQLGFNCFESCHCPDMMGQFPRFWLLKTLWKFTCKARRSPTFELLVGLQPYPLECKSSWAEGGSVKMAVCAQDSSIRTRNRSGCLAKSWQ